MIRYRDYSQVPEWKKRLIRNIGVFGLTDLRKLAPIGDLGYANGWTPIFHDDGRGWMYGEMESAIMLSMSRDLSLTSVGIAVIVVQTTTAYARS